VLRLADTSPLCKGEEKGGGPPRRSNRGRDRRRERVIQPSKGREKKAPTPFQTIRLDIEASGPTEAKLQPEEDFYNLRNASGGIGRKGQP